MMNTRLLMLIACFFSAVGHAEDVTVFSTPPTAKELADIMFPQKTRSIVFDDQPQQNAENNSVQSSQTQAEAEPAVADPSPPNSQQDSTGAFGLLINFDFGKDSVAPASHQYLDAVGEMLNMEQSGNRPILIIGHTDAVGSDTYNQALSERRARSVSQYLATRHRINPTRLYIIGKGESQLYDASNPRAAINRRVEFRLVN